MTGDEVRPSRPFLSILAWALVAVAVTCAFHHRVTFGGQTFAMIGGLGIAPSDLRMGRPVADPLASSGQFEPWLDHLLRERRRHGHTPLWNPWQGCGAPFLANAQTAVFHPIRYVQAHVPEGWRLDVAVLSRIAFGFLGLALLCRMLGLGVLASFAGASAFAFAGYFQFYANMVHVGVEVLLPWHILGVELACRGRTRAGAFVFGGSVVLSHLGGFPESTALVMLVPLMWGLLRLFTSWECGRRLTAVISQAVAVLLATGLCLPVLLPFVEYVGNSVHLHAPDLNVGMIGVEWMNHFGMIVPNLGRYGAGINGPFGFQEPAYVGLTVVTLAIAGVLSLVLPRRKRFGLIFFTLFTALVTAKYYGAPWIREAGKWPILRQVILYKYLGPLIAFGFAGLAAYGLDVFTRRVGGRILLLVAWGVTVWHLGSHVQEAFDLPPDRWLKSPPLWAAIAILLGIVGALVANLWRKAGWVAAVASAGIALVVAGELYTYAPRQRGSREAASRAPLNLRNVLDPLKTQRIAGVRGVFPPNWSTRHEIQDVRFLDALVPAGYHRYMTARFGVTLNDRWDGPGLQTPEVDMDAFEDLGVRYLLAARPWLRGVREPSLPAATGGSAPPPFWKRTEPGKRFLDLSPASKLFLGPLRVPMRSAARVHLRCESIGPEPPRLVLHRLGPSREVFHTPRRTLASLRRDYPSSVATVPVPEEYGGLEPDLFGQRPVLMDFLPSIGNQPISAARLEVSEITWGGEALRDEPLIEARRLAVQLSPDEQHGILIDHLAAPNRLWLPPTDRTRVTCSLGLNLDFPPAVSGDTHLRIEIRARPVEDSVPLDPPERREESLVIDLAEHRGQLVYLELEVPEESRLLFREARLEEQITSYRLVYEDWVSLLENRRAAPLAYLLHQADLVEEEDLLTKLRDPSFAPRRRALVSGLHARPLDNEPPIAEPPVRLTRPHSDRLLLEVAPQSAALLVVLETWDPGWKVKVDGRRVPLVKVFGAFRGVYLEDGDRFVEMTYAPDSYKWGKILASVSAAIALLIAGFSIWRKRTPELPDSE